MKTDIDILIINNVPSFYKINLYNELSKVCKLHVVFIALTNQVVNNASLYEDIQFSYEVLSYIQIEKRSRFVSSLKLLSIIKKYNCAKIIYGGYNDIEQILGFFTTKKSKNCIQFESSILESKVVGFTGFIKRVFFNRFSVALTSGFLQSQVFKSLDFTGVILETKGVGIFNKSNPRNKPKIINPNGEFRYLYVGRLIAIKNLEFLIRIFNRNEKQLTIVGTGELNEKLKTLAKSNIAFAGFIENKDLALVYNSHDVFILPSISEPWGLVVEEALYFGLPVLVSDAVGCKDNMVSLHNTGLVFNPLNEKSLDDVIDLMEKDFDKFYKRVFDLDFDDRDREQIQSYLKILE